MDDQVDLWCEPCRVDRDEFVSRPENVLPDDFPDDEPAIEHQRLTNITAAADAYVRQRAADRKAGR